MSWAVTNVCSCSMESIKSSITPQMAEKIMSSGIVASLLLRGLGVPESEFAGKSQAKLFQLVSQHWDYDEALPLLRDIFRRSMKYGTYVKAEEGLKDARIEWAALGLGPVEWPCMQGDFDNLTQQINGRSVSTAEKDDLIRDAAVRYRRIKEMNTLRNDVIELLMFEEVETLIPTFANRRGVDYFIDGMPFDQKVSRSVTKVFRDKYGPNWRNHALANPSDVGIALYESQSESRFGSENRVLVVNLDSDHVGFEPAAIRTAIVNEVSNPLRQIEFTYRHSASGIKKYNSNCYVVLVH